jgi:hypothetical protein
MQDLVATSMAWLVKLESTDCTSRFLNDVEVEFDEDVIHRVAFTIATRTRDRVNHLRNLRPANGKVDPDLLLLPEYTPRLIERTLPVDPLAQQYARRSHTVRSFRALAAGVIGLCLLCAATARYVENPLSVRNTPHIGGKQEILLPDGSVHGAQLMTVQQGGLCHEANGQLRFCNEDG